MNDILIPTNAALSLLIGAQKLLPLLSLSNAFCNINVIDYSGVIFWLKTVGIGEMFGL